MRISDWSSDVCSSDLLGSSPSASTNLFSHLLDHTQVPIGATGGGFVPFRFADYRAFQLGHVNQQVGIGLQVLHRHVRVAPHHRFRLPARQLLKHRSEEHTSELQSLMRHSYDVFGLKKQLFALDGTYSQH